MGSPSGPFGTFLRPGAWMQRNVNLANRGEEPQQVRLTLASGGTGGETQFFRSVELPAGMERRIWIAYRVGAAPPRPEQTTDKIRTASFRYRLTTATGQQLRQETFSGAHLPDHDRPVVQGMAVGHANLNVVAGDTNSYLKNVLASPQLMSPGLSELPDVWYGYDSADMMILGALEPNALRPSQWQALLEWVRKGNLLLVAGSYEMPQALAGPLGEAAGVYGIGVHEIAEIAVSGIDDGKAVTLSQAMPMAELGVVDAEVVRTGNGLPLLTKHRVGAGHIMVLAVPIGTLNAGAEAEGPGPLHPLFRDIEAALRRDKPVFNADKFFGHEQTHPARETLVQTAGRRGPDRPVPVGLVGGLGVLVVICGMLLMTRRRAELLWVALVPLSLVLGAGLFFYGKAQSDPERVNYIGMVQQVGDNTIESHQAFLYYAGPEGRTLTFTSGGPERIIRPLSLERSNVLTSQVTETAGPLLLPDQEISTNGGSSLGVAGTAAGRIIAGSVSYGPGGITGQLENTLDVPIENAVLYVDGRTYRVGTLTPGANDITVGPSDLLPKVEGDKLDFDGLLARSTPDSLRNSFANRMLAEPGLGDSLSTKPLLVGFAAYTPVVPVLDRQVPAAGWSLISAPLSQERPQPGRAVVVPSGFSDLRIEGPVWSSMNRAFSPSSHNAGVELAITPPAVLQPLQDAAIVVKTSVRGRGFVLRVIGKSPEGEGVVLGQYDDPAGDIELRVDRAGRFLNADGTYLLALDVQRKSQEQPTATQTPRNWRIESLEVTVEGTSQ
jgi:hypothetical protein